MTMNDTSLKLPAIPRLKAPEGEPVPNWDPERMVRRGCLVCGGEEHRPLCYRPDGLLVASCAACGCTYLPLVPDAGELQRYYDRYSDTKLYIQHKVQQAPPSLASRLRACAARTVKTVLGPSLTNGIKRRGEPISDSCEILIRTGGLEGKRILELGPGRFGGILPEATRWGAKGVAVEVDAAAVGSMREMGIEVFDSLAKAPSGLDIIYAGMVLEHVSDPAALLKEAAALAAPGGRFLIRVPNGGQAKSVGYSWIGFRVDLEHLNYFDAASLSTLLAQAGFQTECVWQSAQPVLPQYLAMADRNSFLRYARERFNRTISLQPDTIFQQGEFMLTVLARREE
ncbi:class I SAM-dependent methyltransferase [Geomonas sp. Red32]|uniref:methyltransferase domain-containing protein n=1 Tax=Geomonas sp. Red32 TaxID=2912856 RepID=UPI00202CBF41|nr:methyltransferase domain-containing protein [Geomonas sp. Red32]MCM0081372.1 class I SAM-dependent methyltransferase [Geomonas sp. Red32]